MEKRIFDRIEATPLYPKVENPLGVFKYDRDFYRGKFLPTPRG